MKYIFNFSFILIFCCAVLSAAAVPQAVAPGYFTAGSSWDGVFETFAPVVLDDGSVALTAPAPGTAKPRAHRGVYLVPASLEDAGVQTLIAPDELHPAGLTFTRAPLYLASDAAGKQFWCISQNYLGAGNPAYRLHYGNADGTENYSALNWTEGMRIIPDGSGMNALKFSGTGAELCALDGSALGNGIPLELTDGAKGYQPAFAADASCFYYSAVNRIDGVEWWQLWRHDILTGVNELVDAIRPWSSGNSWSGVVASCSADGGVAAYICGNDADAVGTCIRIARRTLTGSYEYVSLTRAGESALGECAAPAVSANGRYVVFTAANGEGEAAVWRYNVASAELECISGNLLGCASPAVSANGRYAAFAAPDAEGLMQTWRTDCGSAVLLKNSRLSMMPGSTLDAGVEAAADGNESMRITVEPAQAPLTFLAADGTEVLPGTDFPAAALPLTIQAGKEARGSWTVTFALESGASAALQLTVSEFTALTVPMVKADRLNDYIYTDMAFSADGGKMIFLTNASLVPEDADMADDVYLMEIDGGRVQLLSTGSSASFGAPAISADGQVFCWRGMDGSLYRSRGGKTETLLAGSEQNIRFADSMAALSHDGGIMAVSVNGVIMRSTDGGVSFSRLCNGTAPRISGDGSILWFMDNGVLKALCGTDSSAVRTIAQGVRQLCGVTISGGKALVRMENRQYRLYDFSGAQLWEKALGESASIAANGRFVSFSMQGDGDAAARGYRLDLASARAVPQAVTDNDGTAVESIRISPSAKCLVFATASADVTAGAADGNGECDLYLHTDGSWSNKRPTSIISLFYGLEDAETEVPIRNYISDGDGDDLAIITGRVSNGTIVVREPAEGGIHPEYFYIPPADFAGTADFAINVMDGTVERKITFKLDVSNVNDAPFWLRQDEAGNALSYSISNLTAGDSASAQVLADDVDCRNPDDADRDSLTYGLNDAAPEWVTIDAATGKVTAAPGLLISGTFNFEVTVSDGTLEVTAPFSVTVKVPEPVAFTAAQLFGAHGEVQPGASQLQRWQNEVAGCWNGVKDGWQALSVPGTCEAAQLCRVLGCDSLKLWNGSAFVSVREGVIAAGTGFWANVKQEAADTAARLELTPAPAPQLPDDGAMNFIGPIPGQSAPAHSYFAPAPSGVWHRNQGWTIGRAVFVTPEK